MKMYEEKLREVIKRTKKLLNRNNCRFHEGRLRRAEEGQRRANMEARAE